MACKTKQNEEIDQRVENKRGLQEEIEDLRELQIWNWKQTREADSNVDPKWCM